MSTPWGTYFLVHMKPITLRKASKQTKINRVTDLVFNNKMLNQVNTVLRHGEARLQSLVSKLFFDRDINNIWVAIIYNEVNIITRS